MINIFFFYYMIVVVFKDSVKVNEEIVFLFGCFFGVVFKYIVKRNIFELSFFLKVF